VPPLIHGFSEHKVNPPVAIYIVEFKYILVSKKKAHDAKNNRFYMFGNMSQ
jgi:hypothetical protein